ncbi:MAG: CHAT domain-containing protein, partial [Cyanobacteria bacterium J06636_16]
RTDLPDAELIALADIQAPIYRNLERALIAQDKTAEALEITERGRARAFVLQLASRLPAAQVRSVLANPEVETLPSIGEIQQIARDQNATFVTYSLIPDRALHIWVLEPSGEVEFRAVEFEGAADENITLNPIAAIDGPVYRHNPAPSELDTLVADSRRGLGVVGGGNVTGGSSAAGRSSDIADNQLSELHQVLIDPIADLLPTDPEAPIVFVPQGTLFLVPFPALEAADGSRLIEKHTVLTAPSIQVMDLAARGASGDAQFLTDQDAILVGNPIMPEVVIPSESGLHTLQMVPLPGAEAEALAIGELLDISPLIGEQATEARVKQQLPEAPLIHFATHGLLEYGAPDSSGVLDVPGAVALTAGEGEDGLLTAAEILEMNLQAELVVLSACDTGQGRITGDGVVGLSRSLITAGVPSIIVSLWAVPDVSTAALMTEFYRQLRQGQSKAQALRQAMLATLADTPNPVHWAAFTLMGAIE